MKKLLIALFAALCLVGSAQASTTCTGGIISRIAVDSPGTTSGAVYVFYQNTPGTDGASFYFPTGDSNAITNGSIGSLISLATVAKVSGNTVTLIYSGTVTCGTFGWRTDLIDFYLN